MNSNPLFSVGKGLTWLCSLIAIAMMLHVSTDVALRYLFNSPLSGTIEIVAGYYMVAIMFLPLAQAASGEGHIIVELFTRKMKPSALNRLEGVNGLFTVLYLGLLVYATTLEAWAQTRRGEVWLAGAESLAIWPSRWMLPAGAALMGVYTLVISYRKLLGRGVQGVEGNT